MRRAWRIGLLAAALGLSGLLVIPARAAGEKDFRGRMSGLQEAPVISTTGTGEFRGRLDKTEMTLDFELTYDGLSSAPSAAHIHLGQEGVNGGVIAFLCGGGGKPACPASPGMLTGTIVAGDVGGPPGQGIAAGEFAELVAALRAGVVYANVHTDMFPGGEIRGQLR